MLDGKKVRYVKYSSPSVKDNLAAEYYFASEKCFDGVTFMLWQPRPTIVVGRFQNVYEEVDLSYVKEKNIDVVRRLSGGGTVYQDEGCIQYAFIEKTSGGIDFVRYLEPMIATLRSLGIPAERDGRNDITAEGKKVSGNSQYRVNDHTIHHGTLLFSTDLAEMVRATRLPDYKVTSKSIKSVRERVVNMCELTDQVKTPEQFFACLEKSFEYSEVYVPNEYDLRRIECIKNEHFAEDVKSYPSKNSPKFSFEKTCKFDGGTVIVGLSVDRGVVTTAEIKGDFFTECDVAAAAKLLVGVPFERESLKNAVKVSPFSAMGISAEALADKLTADM